MYTFKVCIVSLNKIRKQPEAYREIKKETVVSLIGGAILSLFYFWDIVNLA